LTLEYVCILSPTGYGQSAHDNVLTLSNHYKIGLRNYDRSRFSQVWTQSYKRLESLQKNITNENSIRIFHTIPPRQNFAEKRKKNISFGIFESHPAPQSWVNQLNQNDSVVVASEYNKHVLEDAGVTVPIFVINHTLRHDFTSNVQKKDRFTFLYVGSWRERKNVKNLLKAWKIFSRTHKNVRLAIKTDKIFLAQKFAKELEVNNVIWLDHKMTDQQLKDLFKKYHCLLYPSMGEGFGLPVMFSLAMGVPVIAPNHTGLSEFVAQDTSVVLENYDCVQLDILDNLPQFRNCHWYIISEEEITSKMEWVIENYSSALTKAERGRQFVWAAYNETATLEKWDSLLDQF